MERTCSLARDFKEGSPLRVGGGNLPEGSRWRQLPPAGRPVRGKNRKVNRAASELTHEAQFGTVAVVVLRLGIGLARLVDERQLGAEAEQGQGAVEH